MIGDGVAVLVHRAFAARGLRPDDAAVAEFGRDYGARVAEESRPFPGVAEFLRDHADAGWRMAVCTNKPEAAARKLLDHLGLGHLLQAIGGGDSFPVRKPDPAHLLATLRMAGGDPAASVMVGDHANDVVAAHGAGVEFTDYYRENTLRLAVGEECLYPDCAFQLVLPGGRTFNYLVELDNHSERVRSTKDADSWQRKIRLYDDLQSSAPSRFRVLVVTTRSSPRLRHILALAATLASNPQRSLLLGVPLATHLAEPTPLSAPIFLDHHLRSVSLIVAAEASNLSGPHNRRAASRASMPE